MLRSACPHFGVAHFFPTVFIKQRKKESSASYDSAAIVDFGCCSCSTTATSSASRPAPVAAASPTNAFCECSQQLNAPAGAASHPYSSGVDWYVAHRSRSRSTIHARKHNLKVKLAKSNNPHGRRWGRICDAATTTKTSGGTRRIYAQRTISRQKRRFLK